MKAGVPIIYRGVLHDPKKKTYGIPDLIVRSDWINNLVKTPVLSKTQMRFPSPILGERYHYLIVDIKFTTLALRADGTHLLNSASFPAYKVQLNIYNRALSQLQGCTPDNVYILGRGWRYTSKGEVYSSNDCFDKLGIIDYAEVDRDFLDKTDDAVNWIRECRKPEAADWNIFDYPLHREELYPNMCNYHDHPWHDMKRDIAEKTKELTVLWMVGPKNRKIGLENGICQWTDPDCIAANLGINGEKIGRILNCVIDINKDTCRDLIRPKIIEDDLNDWKNKGDIEFFVDFETTNGAMSSIKKLPFSDTKTIIYMIGVGYINPTNGKWKYVNFTVDRLTYEEEERICNKFSSFIKEKAEEFNVENPKCVHWSRAEDHMWTGAVDRHEPISERWNGEDWDWLDLMEVFKTEPIVIKGCFSFSLKDVAKNMKKHGFISTLWDHKSSCVDGQSAMIIARKAHKMAKKDNISMIQIGIIKEAIKYNEVDVKVMYEIITYLRNNPSGD